MSPTNYFGEPDDPAAQWSLWQIYADLGSRRDIPRALGVSPRQVDRWLIERDHYKVPFPVRHLAHIDVYSMREWLAWFEVWEAEHPASNNYRRRKRF